MGAALAHALVTAGAQKVWVGYSADRAYTPALQSLSCYESIIPVPLDVRSIESVSESAARLSADVDILINNAELHSADGEAAEGGDDLAHAEMEVNYFGLLRLAKEFGPAMRARGAIAWVNVLSIYALTNPQVRGTLFASKAAAYSLSGRLCTESARTLAAKSQSPRAGTAVALIT